MIRKIDIQDCMDKVHNLILHCYKQTMNDAHTVVTLQCLRQNKDLLDNGKRVKDGKPKKNWFITVMVNKDTDWIEEDLTGKEIAVSGQIGIWEDKNMLFFGIRADKVDEYSEN